LIYVELPPKPVESALRLLGTMGMKPRSEWDRVQRTNYVVPYIAENVGCEIHYATRWRPAYMVFATKKEVERFREHWCDWEPIKELSFEETLHPIIVTLSSTIVREVEQEMKDDRNAGGAVTKSYVDNSAGWHAAGVIVQLTARLGRTVFFEMTDRVYYVRFYPHQEQEAIQFKLGLP
jgi:hypothetical protein